MACGACDGYDYCVCDELRMEEKIKNLRNEADSIELKLLKLRKERAEKAKR